MKKKIISLPIQLLKNELSQEQDRKTNHLGLGDIRLTQSQQEEITEQLKPKTK